MYIRDSILSEDQNTCLKSFNGLQCVAETQVSENPSIYSICK